MEVSFFLALIACRLLRRWLRFCERRLIAYGRELMIAYGKYGAESGLTELWTIYQRPLDFPDAAFVARRYLIFGNGQARTDRRCLLSDSYDHLIDQLCQARPGLVRIPRAACDDPCIVESWV